MKNELILPMATYVFFMWISTLLLFKTRVRAIKTGQVTPKYYKAQIGEPPPEKVVLVGRHYDSQFQVPILFFVTGLIHIQMGQANSLTLFLMWFFVATRFLHSWIFLGRNSLRQRVSAFALGWLTIVALWIQLVCLSL